VHAPINRSGLRRDDGHPRSHARARSRSRSRPGVSGEEEEEAGEGACPQGQPPGNRADQSAGCYLRGALILSCLVASLCWRATSGGVQICIISEKPCSRNLQHDKTNQVKAVMGSLLPHAKEWPGWREARERVQSVRFCPLVLCTFNSFQQASTIQRFPESSSILTPSSENSRQQ